MPKKMNNNELTVVVVNLPSKECAREIIKQLGKLLSRGWLAAANLKDYQR